MTEELYKAEEIDVLARQYLNDCGCSQSLQGYFILTKVIGFAVYTPNATSRVLFKKFDEEYNDFGNLRDGRSAGYLSPRNEQAKNFTDKEWLRAYKTARYCYMTAGNVNGKDFFSFIRQGANRVVERIHLKRKEEGFGSAAE